jgi:hypothetical protein
MNKRTLASIALVVAILAFPYWVYIPMLVAFVAVFPFYFEAIIMAFMIDVLYGARAYSGISFFFPFALITSLLVIMILPVKQYFRLHYV